MISSPHEEKGNKRPHPQQPVLLAHSSCMAMQIIMLSQQREVHQACVSAMQLMCVGCPCVACFNTCKRASRFLLASSDRLAWPLSCFSKSEMRRSPELCISVLRKRTMSAVLGVRPCPHVPCQSLEIRDLNGIILAFDIFRMLEDR